MRIPKLFLPVFCFVLIINTLPAQTNLSEGYYIGTAKDTVRGFFNFDNLMYKKILFYTEKTSSTSKKLTPEDISEIETVDKISIRTFNYTGGEQAELIFITRYADGSVSLYEGQTLNPQELKLVCISSIKIPLIRKISAVNTKSYLNTYFKGCELSNNFSVKYDKLSILSAVTEYSKCAYPDAKIEQKTGKSSKISVGIGVQTAAFISTTAFEGFNFNTFRSEKGEVSSNIPLFGGVIALGVSNGLKIYTGLNYFQRHFTSFPQLDIRVNWFELPLSVHYEFKKNNPKFIPKIFVGGSMLVHDKIKVNDVPYNEDFKGLNSFTVFIGGGLKKVFKNKSSVELCLKYAYQNEYLTLSRSIDGSRYELSLAYLLSLYSK
jgi:hypothetical protein